MGHIDNKGFSLVEVLIVMAVSALILMGLMSIMHSTSETVSRGDALITVQADAQVCMNRMTNVLMQAGVNKVAVGSGQAIVRNVDVFPLAAGSVSKTNISRLRSKNYSMADKMMVVSYYNREEDELGNVGDVLTQSFFAYEKDSQSLYMLNSEIEPRDDRTLIGKGIQDFIIDFSKSSVDLLTLRFIYENEKSKTTEQYQTAVTFRNTEFLEQQRDVKNQRPVITVQPAGTGAVSLDSDREPTLSEIKNYVTVYDYEDCRDSILEPSYRVPIYTENAAAKCQMIYSVTRAEDDRKVKYTVTYDWKDNGGLVANQQDRVFEFVKRTGGGQPSFPKYSGSSSILQVDMIVEYGEKNGVPQIWVNYQPIYNYGGSETRPGIASGWALVEDYVPGKIYTKNMYVFYPGVQNMTSPSYIIWKCISASAAKDEPGVNAGEWVQIYPAPR